VSTFEIKQVLSGIAASVEKIAVSVDGNMIHLTKEQFNQIIACVFEGGFGFGRTDLKLEDVLKTAFEDKVKLLSLNENTELIKIIKMYLEW